jgi:hypothetical protein
MDHFLPSKFGFVWISDMITKYAYPIGMMFRDKSDDKTFSGWTFVSGHEDDWRFGSDVDLHDAHAILRCDPSVERYLDLPPGTVLSRQEDGTFAEAEDAEPGASPNGGPTTRAGNSGVGEGPPSVS